MAYDEYQDYQVKCFFCRIIYRPNMNKFFASLRVNQTATNVLFVASVHHSWLDWKLIFTVK